jgi:hypothetical protein
MRALADLAFTMQDYDTALSTLRLLASDLRADKAWKQYAAVQVTILPIASALFLPHTAPQFPSCLLRPLIAYLLAFPALHVST